MANSKAPTPKSVPKQPPRREPHIPLSALRSALGLTIETVAQRMEEETGNRPSRGTISAIEHGRRGLSPHMIHSFELAYGLPPHSITVDYEPHHRGYGCTCTTAA